MGLNYKIVLCENYKIMSYYTRKHINVQYNTQLYAIGYNL